MSGSQNNILHLGVLAIFLATSHGCHASEKATKGLVRKVGLHHQEAKSTDSDSSNQIAFGSEQSWNDWRLRELKRLALASYQSNASYMYETLRKYSPQLESLGIRARCFDNLKRFTKRYWLSKQPDHKLGLDLDDAGYIATLKKKGYLTLPDPLGSQEFLDLIDKTDSDNIESIETRLRSVNPSWRVFYFKSRNLPTVDDSQARGRLFVYVPSELADKFIQFGVRDRVDAVLSESISEIVVEKSDSNHTQSPTANTVYYADLWRVRNQQHTLISTRLESVKTSEACYSCHQSPLLTVKPEIGSVRSDISRNHLEDINNLIKSYSSANVYSLDQADFGPSVGTLRMSGTTAKAVDLCVNSRIADASSALRVRQAMQCDTCHNGNAQSYLHFQATYAGAIPPNESLVKRAVLEDRTMPPNVELSTGERTAVYECLLSQISSPQDLSGDLEQWLLQSDCTASTSN